MLVKSKVSNDSEDLLYNVTNEKNKKVKLDFNDLLWEYLPEKDTNNSVIVRTNSTSK